MWLSGFLDERDVERATRLFIFGDQCEYRISDDLHRTCMVLTLPCFFGDRMQKTYHVNEKA